MFDMITSIAKAAVGVVVAPVSLMVDVVTLPDSALDGKGPFDRTEKTLKSVVQNLDDAVSPGK